MLERWAAEDRFAGVVVDSRDGRRVFTGAYGESDRRHGAPTTEATRFNVGSIGKAFTAAAVLLLEREGRIDLDAPIGRYLQGFPDSVARAVTVRHLLAHRSGWGHYWENEAYRANRTAMREISDYLAFIREIPLDFEPGTRRRYSNVGYEVLGGIVEAVTGERYRDFVRRAVLEPLGMRDTGFFPRDSVVPRVAVGYTRDHPHAESEGWVMENTLLLPPVGTAAGGAYATADDLVRFFEGLVAGEILDREAVALLLNDFDPEAEFPAGPSVLGGGAPGVRAAVLVDPSRDHVAAVLSNLDTPLVSRIVDRLEKRAPPPASGTKPRPARAAPGPGSPSARIDVETRRSVALALADRLASDYVRSETGRRMADHLRSKARGRGWPEATDPVAFARILTSELQRIRSDLHLRVLPPGGPRGPAAGPRRRSVRRGGAGGADGASRPARPRAETRFREPPTLHPDLPTSFRLPEGTSAAEMERRAGGRLEEEREANHHLRRAEVLPGNVGYLDLDRFPIMPFAAPTLDAAMSFLGRVDAFILDLRGNPGGGEGLGQYLASFFFGEEPAHLYSRYYAIEDTTREYWTLPGLPPLRMPDVPLLVLVDGGSGSAAENLAFSLKNTERAKVVGERTAGAGLSSTRVELPGGFGAVLPIARVFDPRTGRDFEGTGVEPDLAVASGEAMTVAHRAAIEELKGRAASRAERDELELAALLVGARSLPALDEEEMAAYEGTYGPRRIRVEDGELLLLRTDVPRAPELPLLRIGPDAFVVEPLPEVRLEFTRSDGGVVDGLRLLRPDGGSETFERS